MAAYSHENHIDMSKYILKSEIPKCPPVKIKNYVHKSKIPKMPDMSKYIRRDKIPCWGCNLK